MTSPIVLGGTPTSSTVIIGASTETIDVQPITKDLVPIGYVIATSSGQTALGGIGADEASYVIGNASGSYAVDIEPSSSIGILTGTPGGIPTIDASSTAAVFPGLVVGLTGSGGGSGGPATIADGSITKVKLDPTLQTSLGKADSARQPVVHRLDIATLAGAPIVDKINYVTCIYTFDGVALSGRIRGRGNSTWAMPKKPWKVKLDTAYGFSGLPASKDWALLANYMDPSRFRNAVAFEIGRRTSLVWSPRSVFTEVWLNGAYQGLYQLIESVAIETTRTNITKIKATDTTGRNLTGGYIVEIDVRMDDNNETGFRTKLGVPIIADDPDLLVPAQMNYIKGQFQALEDKLFSSNFADPVTGFKPLIDIDSWCDWYLLAEVTGNNDSGFGASIRMHKDRDAADGTPGKIRMGPPWDYDLSFGVGAWYSHPANQWWTRLGATWLTRMMEDPAFHSRLVERWVSLKAQIEKPGESIYLFTKRLRTALTESIDGERESWNPGSEPFTSIESWLAARVSFMNTELVSGYTDTTPPASPTGVTANLSGTNLTVSWDAVTLPPSGTVTGYRILLDGVIKGLVTYPYAVDYGSMTLIVISNVSSMPASVQVQARDAKGNWSAPASPPPTGGDVTAPTVPTALSSSVITGTGFTVSWTASTDAVGVTGYRVMLNGTPYATPTGTSQNISGLVSGTAYSVTVQARDAAGNWSAETAPLSVTTSTSGGGGGTSYSVFESGAGPVSLIRSNDPGTIELGNVFYRYADGANAARCVGARIYIPATTPSVAGKAIAFRAWLLDGTTRPDFSLTPSATANLSNPVEGWNEVTWPIPFVIGIGKPVIIDYMVTGDPGTYLYGDMGALPHNAIPSGSIAKIALAEADPPLFGIDPNRSWYRVNAGATLPSNVGTGPWYGVDILVDSGSSDTTAPSVPTGLASSAITGTGFTVSWSPSTDAVGVAGYRVLINGTEYALPTGTSQVVTGLARNTGYSVTVQARDTSGNFSAASTALSVTTLDVGATMSSVFGSSAPPGTKTPLTDGGGNLKMMQGFYYVGTSDLKLVGARLYVPSGLPASFYTQVDFFAALQINDGSTVQQPSYGSFPINKSLASLVPGWNEVLFDTEYPFNSFAEGAAGGLGNFAWVGFGYQNGNNYMHTSDSSFSTAAGISVSASLESNNLPGLNLSEQAPFQGRSRNNLGDSGGAFYGIDILVKVVGGAGTFSALPAQFPIELQ